MYFVDSKQSNSTYPHPHFNPVFKVKQGEEMKEKCKGEIL
jgi:hypothetical protein